MTLFSREEQLALAGQANLAPSVHNTQPARFRFVDDGVLLCEDMRRRLAVGDPHGRDAMTSLGAALEGLHLALGERGLGIVGVTRINDAPALAPGLRPVARAEIGEGTRDDIVACVGKRRSHRGKFLDARDDAVAALRNSLGSAGDVTIVSDADGLAMLAALNDRCAYEFMHDPAYQGEVYEWTRLSPSDARWHRDGLTADCLAMSGVERVAARMLFRPRAFAMLDRIGVARMLVSEAAQVKSAAAVVVLHRRADEDELATGRRFYRLWLEFTRAGLAACPMSSLADSASGSAEIAARWPIAPGRRIVNAFRVGRAPDDVPLSPRLPAAELLV